MLRNVISEREKDLPYMTIGRFLKLAEENSRYISLGPGEPDFDAPKNVVKACKRALDSKKTHYTAISGIPELKEAIVKKLKKDNKIRVNPEEVMVTTGSTEGLLLSLMATLDPGEGALIPDPGFLAYLPIVEVLNGRSLPYPLIEENEVQIASELLTRTIKKKTRILILNSPSNPLGIVSKKKTLEEIADFVTNHNLFVVTDEAYEKLVYEVKHFSFASLNGMEDRTLTLQTFSKSYAMPGFRIGYAAGPSKLIKAMAKLKIFSTLSPPTPCQYAAVEALQNSGRYVESMRKEYDKRRKYLLKRLEDIGLPCQEPQGAFYAFPNISEFKKKSLAFSEFLLKKAGVITIPGTEFGKHGEGYIRLSYATELSLIKKAMDKIEKALMNI